MLCRYSSARWVSACSESAGTRSALDEEDTGVAPLSRGLGLTRPVELPPEVEADLVSSEPLPPPIPFGVEEHIAEFDPRASYLRWLEAVDPAVLIVRVLTLEPMGQGQRAESLILFSSHGGEGSQRAFRLPAGMSCEDMEEVMAHADGSGWTRSELERATRMAIARINQSAGADVPFLYLDTSTAPSECAWFDANCDGVPNVEQTCTIANVVHIVPDNCDGTRLVRTRFAASSTYRMTSDTRRWRRRVVISSQALGSSSGWSTSQTDPAPSAIDDTVAGGLSIANEPNQGVRLTVFRRSNGDMLLQAATSGSAFTYHGSFEQTSGSPTFLANGSASAAEMFLFTH